LRTLYLAERIIPEQEYEEWNEKSRLSKLEVNNREEAVAKVDGEIEKDLELIGSTAIEDKL
jgi:magnesium-transporting ATPase (P-type)